MYSSSKHLHVKSNLQECYLYRFYDRKSNVVLSFYDINDIELKPKVYIALQRL